MYESNIYARWLLATGERLGLDRASFEVYAGEREWDMRPMLGASPWSLMESLLQAIQSRMPPDRSIFLYLAEEFEARPFARLDQAINAGAEDLGTVGQNAMDVLHRFSGIRQSSISKAGGDVICAVRPTVDIGDRTSLWTDVSMLATVLSGNTLHGFRPWLKELRLGGSPQGTRQEYEETLGVPVRFGFRESQAVYDMQVLGQHTVRSELWVHRGLRTFFLRRLHYAEQGSSRNAIHFLYRFDEVLADSRKQVLRSISDKLNMSPRMLQYSLKREGTSLREIWEHSRADLALGLLSQSDITIRQVSRALGFSDTPTFQRAFKKWFGFTPRDYQILSREGRSRERAAV